MVLDGCVPSAVGRSATLFTKPQAPLLIAQRSLPANCAWSTALRGTALRGTALGAWLKGALGFPEERERAVNGVWSSNPCGPRRKSRPASILPWALGPGPSALVPLGARQPQHERRPHSRCALERNVTIHRAGEIATDREPEASSFLMGG